jgi:hypothetical protein
MVAAVERKCIGIFPEGVSGQHIETIFANKRPVRGTPFIAQR